MTRGQALFLRAFAVWTVYVWTVRIWNIARDDHDLAFKLVHSVLGVVSMAFAVGAWVVVSRVRSARRRPAGATAAAPSDAVPTSS